ncbi:MAG TPA: cytochrome c oxidase subunit II [Stellaceae bacterium]|nr:cytochrome c oxidase subunit II [Stellaceae bacterium]
MRRRLRLTIGLLALLPCSGCSGWQSALSPHGPHAAHILGLLRLFVAVSAVVWLAVVLVLLGALFRRRMPAESAVAPVDAAGQRRSMVAVVSATGATVLVIVGLTLASYLATRGLADAGDAAVEIKVRGHQWWWQATYNDAEPDRVFQTANEIHIPVGRPVNIELMAADVIHSFWVPDLAGKQDQIPGRDNSLSIVADRPGVYRGQCAEFCGLQHAHMALIVVAEPPPAFEAWRNAQIAEAAAPANDEQEAGRKIFAARPCAACHTVRGTSAAGANGPDLTHVGSRQYIAAGILPTTRGSLAAWIADPQTIKPGNNMPLVDLSADELRAVSAYLASLR